MNETNAITHLGSYEYTYNPKNSSHKHVAKVYIDGEKIVDLKSAMLECKRIVALAVSEE